MLKYLSILFIALMVTFGGTGKAKADPVSIALTVALYNFSQERHLDLWGFCTILASFSQAIFCGC